VLLLAARSLSARAIDREAPAFPAIAPETPAESTAVRAVSPSLDDLADVPINPSEYVVGPGDRLAVTTWGRVNTLRTVIVTPEGDIVVPGAGAAHVGGMSLVAARERIASLVRSQLLGTHVDVHLEGVRRFKVYVLGSVVRPQAIRAAATLRVSEVIDRAGGLTKDAAQRGILLKRADGSVVGVDLIGFQRTGTLNANPLVREGDAILVPARGAVFTIEGAVGYSGIYDLVPGDSLGTAFALAGGTFPGAELERVEYYRFLEGQQRGPFLVDATRPDARRMPLEDGDRVFVRRSIEWHRDASVSIGGEVLYPGTYVIASGETVGGVIARAGGFTSFADSSAISVDRPVPPSPAYEEVRPFEKLDPTRLRDSDLEMLRLTGLTRPGFIPVNLRDRPGDRALSLRAGDRLEVPRVTQQVRVAGEVRKPGLVPYRPGATAKDYVLAAGGFTAYADKRHVRVSKLRGWHTIEAAGTGPLEQGDVVWVLRKPRSDAWSRIRDAIGIVASLATVYLVVQRSSGTSQ
jgi:protein involved in polysaccharide export with SLBB domain